MKRIVLQQFATVDGFAADPDGRMDFQQAYVVRNDRSFQEHALAFLDTVDTMIMGANTYRMFAGYWPEATHEGVFAEKLNALSKVVVSSSLESAPWGRWGAAEIVRDHVPERIGELKEQTGKDIVVWGSLTLSYELLGRGLIDEIQLRVCPSAIGSGKPVFPGRLDLRLLEARTYDEGMVLLRYEPVG